MFEKINNLNDLDLAYNNSQILNKNKYKKEYLKRKKIIEKRNKSFINSLDMKRKIITLKDILFNEKLNRIYKQKTGFKTILSYKDNNITYIIINDQYFKINKEKLEITMKLKRTLKSYFTKKQDIYVSTMKIGTVDIRERFEKESFFFCEDLNKLITIKWR